MLHWAWEGVYRSVLQRVMSLTSTNPHDVAETAVSPVALLQSSCENDTESWNSMQISARGCNQLYSGTNPKKLIVKCCIGHGCVQVCIAASNELASTNPHEMVRAETANSTVTLLQSSCGNNTQLWD